MSSTNNTAADITKLFQTKHFYMAGYHRRKGGEYSLCVLTGPLGESLLTTNHVHLFLSPHSNAGYTVSFCVVGKSIKLET